MISLSEYVVFIMKTIVSFTCICLFAFVQTESVDQTTFTGAFIFIKEIPFSEGTELLNSPNIPFRNILDSLRNFSEVISTKGNNDSGNQDGHINWLKTIIDKVINHEVNNESEDLIPDRTITSELVKQSSKNETSEMTCTEKDERYPIPDSCDSYIECKNGTAEKKQCPDGLRYKHNTTTNPPCMFPADVQCNPGATLQPPKPTEDCPNQNGYFKTKDRHNCNSFRICVNGIGHDFDCPFALAFNSLTSRCDWPDQVPQCNAEGKFGFRCPKQPGSSMNTPISYRSKLQCDMYYTCINGQPRALECSNYFAFDEATQSCVPAFAVSECTEKQKRTAGNLLRQTSNGEWRVIDDDDEYFASRAAIIRFAPKGKKPITVL